MALQLTTREQRAVSAKRQQPRPTYYNATVDTDLEIGPDFEAFLILAGEAKLRAAVDWITTVSDLGPDGEDRDGILKEWLDAEAADLVATKSEVDDILKPFDTWRTNFVAAGKFGGVGELQTMLIDLQAPAAELFTMQRRLQHAVSFVGALQAQLHNAGLKSGQLQQTTSWIGPLLAY